MKTSIFTLLLLLTGLTSFSQKVNNEQNINFEVHGTYTRSIHQDQLSNAGSLGDIMPYYPAAWIMSYNSAEVSTTSNGTAMSAPGDNDILTDQQKNILRTADLGSNVVINIIYKTNNSATGDPESRIIHYDVTVIPEIEAEYSSGKDAMNKYLKDKAIDKLTDTKDKPYKAVVSFTVSEEGKIADAQITKSSGSASTDKLLLKAITKMPDWKPAQKANGTKVKQNFEFTVDTGTDGC